MGKRGNPYFGTLYQGQPLVGEEPLSSRPICVKVPSSHREELMKMSPRERANLLREAIARALAERKKTQGQETSEVSGVEQSES